MLGTRTKQVIAYGRRGQRIVNISGERKSTIELQKTQCPSESSDSDEEAVVAVPKPPTRVGRTRKKSTLVASEESEDEDVDDIPLPTKTRGTRKPHKTSAPSQRSIPSDQNKSKRSQVHKRSPKSAKVGNARPIRQPLSICLSNVPGSPAVVQPVRKKGRPVVAKCTPLKSTSPIVDVDIVVLDDSGRRISQEKRVSRTDVQVNQDPSICNKFTQSKPRIIPKPNFMQISDDDEDDFPVVHRPPINKRRNKLIVISDSESPGSSPAKPIVITDGNLSPDPPKPLQGQSRSSVAGNFIGSFSDAQESNHPPVPSFDASFRPSSGSVRPFPQSKYGRLPNPPFIAGSARTKPHQLTPIRHHAGRAAFPSAPFPPSPCSPVNTDLDLSLDFGQLALSPATRREFELGLDALELSAPEYLRPLLDECSQSTPHEFSAFIEMFPLDPIVQTSHHGVTVNDAKGPYRFQKIGEASYSEVFGIGDVVLKIIPLRDATGRVSSISEDELDSPAPSDVKDVIKEIVVTREMGEICEGFVKLLRTYVVRGKYPSLLLDLWDEYHERKGSESVRPDTFTVSQTYAIIVLPNGGPDLEAYNFPSASKTGWRQACSLFWQVTRALAEAEDLVRFEHRDLHWGQILVKNTTSSEKPKRRKGERLPMDHELHGLKATVIDLGLARMDAMDGTTREIRWTPFDEEIFEGQGDYQFDVYRMMRVHNADSWESYSPLTNVMWLHYLILKLLHSKRIPAPSRRAVPPASTSTSTYTEQECYQCLLEIEHILGEAVACCKIPAAPKKGRRKTPQPAVKSSSSNPQSATQVLRIAIDKGWVRRT
ncbi:hypothetical protein K474DRAFT_1655109 [Panus rudis PR-1116 ss-1]|nr:hypothetical protein K474DRAFT_1655109 [Panus rudis PR-1116 ss-1]